MSVGLLLALAALPAGAAQLTWLTDLPQALAQAKANSKSVLLVFHGSDWCPPCVKMQSEVLDSPKFMDYARQALVLVDVDFPEKSRQSDSLKQANQALKAKFNVGENYPTLVLLNESGETVYQEAGYEGGGASTVLTRLERHAKVTSAGEEQSGYKNLSVADFAKMAANQKNVVLDVRTAREFEAGHIDGAINLDVLSSDFDRKAAGLDKSKTYLVHCASGVRSVKACKELGKLDFPKLYNLPGGFRAWVKAGEPVAN